MVNSAKDMLVLQSWHVLRYRMALVRHVIRIFPLDELQIHPSNIAKQDRKWIEGNSNFRHVRRWIG